MSEDKDITPDDSTEEERKAKDRAYYEANKEKRKAQMKAHRKANPEKMKAYREANKEKRKAALKAYNATPERKAKQKVRNTTPERKAYNKASKATPEYKAAMKAYNATPKGKSRDLKWKYGLTLHQRDAMILAQGNRCLCCKTLFGLLRAHKPFVDHSHKTGRVRGILCCTCNTLLGHAADNPKILRTCARYLEQHARSDRDSEASQATA